MRTWALAGGLVLYLGVDGGGYDIVVRNQVGVVLWWIVLVGAACGMLPVTRLTRVAWAALALLTGFVIWTALASTWSLSAERSLQELSRVASYLAVLLLAVSIHSDRERAVRQSVNAVATAITAVATLALVSRLVPGAFPSSHVTATFLVGARARLGWPVNYWNGLAALVAFGLPLLLSIATSARTLIAQAAAAAALPLLTLCGYLTFSRGGALAGVVAVLAFLVLSPGRLPKLATALVGAAGGAVLIAGAVHRSAVENGLINHAATVQGRQLIAAVVVVCAGAALAQIGIGLAARHGTLPRFLQVTPRTAGALLATGAVLLVVAGVAAAGTSSLSPAWQDFKHKGTTAPSVQARFGSTAGNGRYDMWRIAVQSTKGPVVGGSGPGTYQLIWEPRAPYYSYVINAHSLYFETLAELGVAGLGILVAFLGLVLVAAVRLVTRSRYEARAYAAGAAAALLAFSVSALADWIWQLPVLPAAFLLIGAAVLAPAAATDPALARRATSEPRSSGGYRNGMGIRVGLVAAAIACLAAISVPLATATAVRKSQAAVSAGQDAQALKEASSATRIEPGAASAHLQVALVLELLHNIPAARQAAIQATHDEPQNWTAWLVLSRLQAESGHARASVAAYSRARSLNPKSPLFKT